MRCPNCAGPVSGHACLSCGTIVSVGGDSLDSLILKGSVPNLAAMFKKAKDAGLIVAGKDYGDK